MSTRTSSPARPAVRVWLDPDGRGELRFDRSFRIGRGAQCEVQVASGLVSREHAEITFEDGQWWVRDLNSTNGVYLDGQKVQRAPLPEEATLKLGPDAPTLWLRLEGSAKRAAAEPMPAERALDDSTRASRPPSERTEARPPQRARGSAPARAVPSVSQAIDRYFEDDGGPAGEHTRIIRTAYAAVRKKQRRRYGWVLGGLGVLLVAALAYAVLQRAENDRLRAQAAEYFEELRRLDLDIAQLHQALEVAEDESLQELLARAEARRASLTSAYDGLIEEFGLYRRLNEEEEGIYRMARVFGESQFAMPAGFVREVQRTIDDYWLSSAGRGRFARAVRQAEANGYTRLIVDTLRTYGLPPEFFYLALQESNLDPSARGPLTRWGRAKGMWQFIPSTAQRYGLDVGARPDMDWVDPQDQRHDVPRATGAAARYLLDIYGTAAQASGLLVMASYNWGEHRVIRKLEELPASMDAEERAFIEKLHQASGAREAIEAAFEGVEQNPEERNYWRFLETYEARMPEETKDYVLKIFAAAVIGQDPRRYGFDFDNPLWPYLEGADEPLAIR